jgi:membrane protease YdiL (CAAX protease family)
MTEHTITSPRLGAARAFAIFALVFLAQFLLGIAAIVLGVVFMAARGGNVQDASQVAQLVAQLNPALIIGAVAISGLTTYVLMQVWTPAWLRDRSETGFGVFRISPRQLAIAVISGAGLAVAYLTLCTFFPIAKGAAGPLAQVATSGGSGRMAWTFVALILAPPTEEVLFRGLLLKGLRESWGLIPASIVVTLLFWVSHFFEIANYWPAMIAILTLAILALVIRIKSGSVSSAIVVHTSYNALIVVALYAGRV